MYYSCYMTTGHLYRPPSFMYAQTKPYTYFKYWSWRYVWVMSNIVVHYLTMWEASIQGSKYCGLVLHWEPYIEKICLGQSLEKETYARVNHYLHSHTLYWYTLFLCLLFHLPLLKEKCQNTSYVKLDLHPAPLFFLLSSVQGLATSRIFLYTYFCLPLAGTLLV